MISYKMINLLMRCPIKFDRLYKIHVPVRLFKNQSFYRRHKIRVKSKVKEIVYIDVGNECW